VGDGMVGLHASMAKSEKAMPKAQAKKNLARLADNVEVHVEKALNRLNPAKEMVNVSEELLALRTDSSCVTAEQFSRGGALQSQAEAGVAQELDAKTRYSRRGMITFRRATNCPVHQARASINILGH
jgi:hypothetical protein